MHRKLFYVSASILMLALAFHLGAAMAIGQVSGALSSGAITSDGVYAVSGRTIVVEQGGSYGQSAPIPGSSPVLAGKLGAALTADGTIWSDEGGAWHPAGQFPVGPTAARRQSWGALKYQALIR